MCDRPVSSANINLTDCLSCSGCVTIDENDLSYMEGIESIKKGNTNIIITPQVKIALYTMKKTDKSFRAFEYHLLSYLSRNNNKVIDSSIGTKLLLQQEIDLVDKNRTTISTICPGTVLYLCSALDRAEELLSNNLSPIEISATYIRKLNNNKNISIVMCKDKRVEAKNNTIIDYSITAKELHDNLLGKTEIEDENKETDRIEDIPKLYDKDSSDYDMYKYGVSRVLKGSTAGGVFESVLSHVLENKINSAAVVKQNAKHNEMLIAPENRRLLQLFSSSRIVSFISKVKKDRSILNSYIYIEMNMCAGGCLYGPSQGVVSDSNLYFEIQNDKISQETVEIESMEGKRAFTKYRKPKERKNYLVQW
ncbi:hypothetical protein NEMIN01_1700 [Nematocida minor]|uniref:uncharacterized protein n=1 Tax=Nematocida minor TaxID=1912983 RepID=UPI002220A828|nr:uncharacterized protein NEMIN01_1700 [Nematocida minor]KAI5191845.1 hypothetical protein NEMIN01_1700 [Nematocida minor]